MVWSGAVTLGSLETWGKPAGEVVMKPVATSRRGPSEIGDYAG
jgi:hypothetical protein